MGNEEFENWLLWQMAPRINFRFYEVSLEVGRLVVLEIERALRQPVHFRGQEFIRIGSYKKRLKDFAEREPAPWQVFNIISFEEGVALERQDNDAVLLLLDYPSYFELMEMPLPANRDGILDALERDRLIRRCAAGGWDVMNLGMILFGKRLVDHHLGRKAMRVIQYRGNSRIEMVREQVGSKGYASGFEGIVSYINSLVPSNEVVQRALRKEVPRFPVLAIRELVANALVHQDFQETGSGPMVEVFDDRLTAWKSLIRGFRWSMPSDSSTPRQGLETRF